MKQSEKSEATKKRLIECAEKLFIKKGFQKTAVKEIVKAAGVAQGTFYLYFETKEDVLYEIIEHILKIFNSYMLMLDVENPCLDDINHIIDCMVLYMQQNPQCIQLLHNANILELIKYKKNDTVPEWFVISVIEKWLENACIKGIIQKKSPQLYSRIIFQIAHELLEASFLYGYPGSIEIVKEELKQIIKDIL